MGQTTGYPGRIVTVSTGDTAWEGMAEAVDADGALLYGE